MVYFPGETSISKGKYAHLKIGPGLYPKSTDQLGTVQAPVQGIRHLPLPGDIFRLCLTLLFCKHIAG